MKILNLAKATLLIAFVLPLAALAADPPEQVGRITYIEGDVSFFSDRSTGWTRATQNYPVTSENSVWTNGPARAEVRIGPTAVRLDDNSVLDFIEIDDGRTRALLQRGTIYLRLRALQGERSHGVEIDVADGRITLEGNGRYRIEADESLRESRVTVMAGRARFAGLGRVTTIEAGRAFFVGGGRAQFESARTSEFDQWAMTRDAAWDQTHNRYAGSGLLSPSMTGYEDLDANGEWIDDREYGRLWTPHSVVADWAPYRHGHWAHVSPWGWTWVDDAPWGFAPFHYGRWLTIGSRWFWSPGSYGLRPVYAPALVAWQGYPGGTDSFSATVGWFPLGPHEHYVPHYRHNAAYLRNINHIRNHNTVIAAPTRFANHVHGRTHVPHNVFAGARPVAPHAIHAAADGRHHHSAPVTMTPPNRGAWRAPHGGTGPQHHRGGREAEAREPPATTGISPAVMPALMPMPTPRGYPRRPGERASTTPQDVSGQPIVNSPQPPMRPLPSQAMPTPAAPAVQGGAPMMPMPPPRQAGMPRAPQQSGMMPPLVPSAGPTLVQPPQPPRQMALPPAPQQGLQPQPVQLGAPVLAPPVPSQRPMRVQSGAVQPMILAPAVGNAPVMNSPAPPPAAERHHQLKPALQSKPEGKDKLREPGQSANIQ